MKKKIFFLFLVLMLLTAALTACGLFGESSSGKVTLTEDMIYCSALDSTYVYTGNPVVFADYDVQVRLNGDVLDRDLFELEYLDNVEAGTASLVVTAKEDNPSVKGSVTLHFTIIPNTSVSCVSSDDLAELLLNPSVSGVQLWSDYTIPEGVTVTVPEGKSLNMIYGYHLQNYGTIENNGTIVMRGALLSTGGRKTTKLTNYGKIENHGEMEIKDYVTVNDLGVFESDDEIDNRGTIYLLDEEKSFFKNNGGACYVRKALTPDKILVEDCTFQKGIFGYYPGVSLKDGAGVDFETSFANNEKAGTASVTVTVGECQQYYYGEATATFVIKKGVASVRDYEELKSLAASGNFEEYQLESLSFAEGQTFALPQGETLTIRGNLIVDSSFENGGAVSCANFELGSNGSFDNAGTLSVSGASFTTSGTFVNQATGSFLSPRATVQVRVGSTFTNKAIFEETRGFSVYGTLVNEGTLPIADGYVSGTIRNSGEITFPTGMRLYKDGSFQNAAGGKTTFQSDNDLNGEISNDGAMTNLGRISVADGVTFRNAGTFDNTQGGVWAFAAIAGIEDNLVIRKYLTDERVSFAAEYSEVYYDKQNHVPSFTVDGKTLPSSECGFSCRYLDKEKAYTEFKITGTVRLLVTIRTNYSEYAGSINHDYRILPATIRVASLSDYGKVYSDSGYERIILDTDLSLPGSSYYVGYDCTLDLNGHSLRVGNIFSVYGRLEGAAPITESFTPSEENASVIVEEKASFYNYGTIVNDGLFLVIGGGTFKPHARAYQKDEQGVLVNNGLLYTNSAFAISATGTGRIYQRVTLTGDGVAITVPTATYDGTEQTPTPTVYLKGQPVSSDRFLYRYSFNTDAGSKAMVYLTVADTFDQNFYGKTSVYFTIARGSIAVFGENSFAEATANVNYCEIVIGCDFMLSRDYTLSEGQTVDLGYYELSGSGKVTMATGCRLVLKADKEARFVKYFYGADEITLTENIGKAGTPTELTFGVAGTPTELTFGDYRLANYQNLNYLSTTVHMEGFSFVGGLKIVNSSIENFACTFENSSDQVSTIGSSVTGNANGYALIYGTCYEETYVTLRGLTVYGVYHHGGSGTAQVVDLSAENCTFLADRDRQDAYAFRVWTSMTASGTYTNCTFDGANAYYVNRGYEYDHDASKTLPAYFFYNCTLNAYAVPDKTEYYGNALTMDRNKSNLYVQVNGTHLYSQNGNCIRVTNRTGVYLDIDSSTSFEHAEGKANVLG